MALKEYRKKRHFAETPEPRGKRVRSKAGHRFVVQKHAARRLHYDFRLEIEGVLKSWAVPKGPCLDPAEKRLAAHVEDHPIEYLKFEGIIPQGQYGGGTVIVWDLGTWECDRDIADDYRRGRMKFRLDGEKLRGTWNLVRMRARKAGQDEWLLIKSHDDAVRPLSEFDVERDLPDSVLTGRSIEEVAQQADRVWDTHDGEKIVKKRRGKSAASKSGVKSAGARRDGRRRASHHRSLSHIEGAVEAKMPAQIEIELASLKPSSPSGPGWLHEIKFDGYRILCRIEDGKVALITRKALNWANRFPELAADLADLPVQSAWFDGEVVALRPDGVSNFGALQSSFRKARTDQLTYCAFDLLYLDGYDLRRAAIVDRKKLLHDVLAQNEHRRVQFVDHVEGNGNEFFKHCCEMGLEGAIHKRADRPYRAGRTEDWLKVKCRKRENFVIGGYVDPTDRKTGLGSILVGSYRPGGGLQYEGRVGTGFTEDVKNDLLTKLRRASTSSAPFENPPKREGFRRLHWVRPELVADIEFADRTDDGLLRQASFQGLQKEVPASSIVHEPPLDESKEPPAAPHKRSKRTVARRASAIEPPDLEKELEGVTLSHPNKVMYPRKGITKLDLVKYYVTVGNLTLPHVVHRPLSLVRCPDGAGGQCFYQKQARAGMPERLARIPISEHGKQVDYLMVEDLAGLASLVQMGILEIHPWGSRGDLLERPDRMFFDLDPDEAVSWRRTVAAAHRIRALLEDLGLVSFVKTTGGKGLHVVVPLARRHTWDEIKAFSQGVARQMVAESPRDYVATMSKAARKDKIYIDFQRNARGATAVAPYSTRAREDATVSMPLHWEEVGDEIKSDSFDIAAALERVATMRDDPWAEINEVEQSLSAKAQKRLGV